MASSDPQKQSKCSSFMEFMYNSKDGTVMGRTGMSWAKIGVFYAIFYACLAGFFAIMLALFFLTIDKDAPRLTGMESLLKNNPGMSFSPQIHVESTLIRIRSEDSKAGEARSELENFMKPYKKGQLNDLTKDCKKDDKPNSEESCIFDDTVFQNTDCTEKMDYGFTTHKPCIALTLNRIYNWEAEVYEKNDTNAPEIIRNQTDGEFIIVKCEGENPLDKELMGEVEYTPKGFSKKYFPYLHQRGYLSPVVMVQFKGLRQGVLVQVECKAYAKNIKHHRNDRAGSTHFELVSD